MARRPRGRKGREGRFICPRVSEGVEKRTVFDLPRFLCRVGERSVAEMAAGTAAAAAGYAASTTTKPTTWVAAGGQAKALARRAFSTKRRNMEKLRSWHRARFIGPFSSYRSSRPQNIECGEMLSNDTLARYATMIRLCRAEEWEAEASGEERGSPKCSLFN